MSKVSNNHFNNDRPARFGLSSSLPRYQFFHTQRLLDLETVDTACVDEYARIADVNGMGNAGFEDIWEEGTNERQIVGGLCCFERHSGRPVERTEMPRWAGKSDSGETQARTQQLLVADTCGPGGRSHRYVERMERLSLF